VSGTTSSWNSGSQCSTPGNARPACTASSIGSFVTAPKRWRNRPMNRSAAAGSSITSLTGRSSRAGSFTLERWLSGSKRRIDSTVAPKKSSRTGSGWPLAKMSMSPPRTAYSPASTTAPVRR
jgi:hypothetical protein